MNESSPSLTSGSPGKLRIFLGYAAGVGKTYAMLEAAHRRQAEGADVVLAYVDTHHLPETEALAAGFETMPRRLATQQDITTDEMDLQAVLARKPDIALVDELAHVNPPDSLHSRRYQDVEELLSAGIDVYTTVNVQHIESLNDIVTQITGITVEDTVPDRIFDEADQVELIDMLPEDLLQRLRNGGIHIPDQGARMMHKLFRPGNLTALREMAMRQTARRIDDQMRAYMQTQSIAGPWAASERLLVCISASPLSTRLIRAGCRLAKELDAPWHAVYVETPSQMSISQDDRARLNQTMSLAEGLGAKVMTITGQSIADALIQFARQNNITKIIIGQPLRSRWQELIYGSVVSRLIKQSGPIDIYVMNSGADTPSVNPVRGHAHLKPHFNKYLQTVIVIALITILGSLIHMLLTLNPADLVMFYLAAVVIVALRLGYGPAVMTAFASVIVLNFFFVPPQLTFHVDEAEYLLTFVGLIVTGVVIANLTSRARQQTEAAQRRERETAQLYSLSRELVASVDLNAIIQTILEHVQQTFQSDAAIFLPQDNILNRRAASPGYQPDPDEQRIATWAFEHSRPAGASTQTMRTANARYVPLKTAQKTIGILSLMVEEPVPLEKQRLIDAFATQAALAIDASRLSDEARQAQLLREKEKLQSALLNSISHDLRTPLVSITGSLSTLRDSDASYDATAVRELLDGAYMEAERLNRLVGNLLDMSRLDSGSLKLKREPYDMQEIIGVARSQLRNRLENRTIHINLPNDLPLIPVDLVLFAQVIVNLIDNALKYSEPDTALDIWAEQQGDAVEIGIADRGIGIPEDELPYIFEKFYRTRITNGHGGSGLGLSICQGIVEAHGGTIRAEPRDGGGTCFIIRLPVN